MSDVRVNDVMTRLVVALNPSDSMHHAAQKLSLNHISGAPVVEEGRVVGIVSESDLIHAVMPPVTVDRGTSVMDVLTVLASAKPRRHAHGKTVADAMSPLVIQVSPSTSIWKAASIMERQGVNRLPVVDNEDRLLGIVSRADVVRAMARDDEQIRSDVIEAIEVLGSETIHGLRVEGNDGVITLRGIADRKSTSDLAVKLASRTPGVVEVISKMGYEAEDTRTRVPPESDPKDPRLDWHAASELNETAR